jgi:hypothetical protein
MVKPKFLFFFVIFFFVSCSHVVKEDEVSFNAKSLESIHAYKATFYFSSIFGSTFLKVYADIDKQNIFLLIKDAADPNNTNYLRYQYHRWAYKNSLEDKTFYFISDKSFLKYLNLNSILPNSSFLVHFLLGTFPYQDKVKQDGEVKLRIKSNNYEQVIYIIDYLPTLLEIYAPNKTLQAKLKYGEKKVEYDHFILPSFLEIQYLKKKLTFSLSIKDFEPLDHFDLSQINKEL